MSVQMKPAKPENIYIYINIININKSNNGTLEFESTHQRYEQSQKLCIIGLATDGLFCGLRHFS